MADEPEDKTKVTPEEPEEPEAPKEPETPTPEPTPEPEPEPIPSAEIVPEEVAAKVKDEFTKKILNALGVTPEDAEAQDLIPPWEKEGRNPKTYGEMGLWAADLADKRAQARETEKEEKQKTEQTAIQQNQEEYNKQLNASWDTQLDELREKNLIPRVEPAILGKINKGTTLTEDERKDEGLVAQKELFEMMFKTTQERATQGKSPIINLKEVYYEIYTPAKAAQPAGSEAPISGGEKSVETGRKEETDYLKDIKSKTFYDIISQG